MGLARRTVPAQKLWFSILDSQVETGTPYLLYKVKLSSLALNRALVC